MEEENVYIRICNATKEQIRFSKAQMVKRLFRSWDLTEHFVERVVFEWSLNDEKDLTIKLG